MAEPARSEPDDRPAGPPRRTHAGAGDGHPVADAVRRVRRASRLTLPNLLTVVRLLLVPVILALMVTGTRAADWWAFAIFVFAAVTDKVDGWMARRWEGVTRWGELADPVADKLLILGTLSTLALLERLPWWAVIVIACREVAVTLLRVRLVKRHRLAVPATRWGKWKTAAQVVAVALFLMPAVPEAARVAMLYAAVALTIVSGVHYAYDVGRRLRAGEGDRGARR